MKKIILLLTFTFLQICIFAQHTEHYLKIYINDRSELETLTRMVSIDNVIGNEVIAYANDREFNKLTFSQFSFDELEHPSVQSGRAITMATTVEEMANWNRYPTYSVYNQLLKKFTTDYPDLCKLDTVGTSILNRNILVLNITADIHNPKPKPEILFSSTIHGDEVTGWILALRLCDYLLSNYASDPRITSMLDSISFFFAPNTNPDGTFRPSDNSITNAQRYNNAGEDLNRDYPDPRIGQNTPWQKETQVMMDYAGTRHFSLGINYHGGAEVVNYPWDTWTSSQRKHADHNWYIQISSKYAGLAKANGGGFTSVTSSGYTNGGDWYVITGGRQDYMNYWHSCREITLEVSNIKMPQSENLPNYWNYNKEAMLTFLENVKYGIRGTVTNTDGEPLAAKITVVGHDKDNSQVQTNPQFGYYYRMIEPGSFTLLFESYGYESQIFTGIQSQLNKTTILDVVMQRVPVYTISGVVVNATTGFPMDNVKVEVKNTPLAPVMTNGAGSFSFELQSGSYQFVFTKKDFIKRELTVVITENTEPLLITLQPIEGFSFEDGIIPPGFTFSGNQNWYIVSGQAYHGTKSIRSGNITHNQESNMLYTFTANNPGTVLFYSKVSSEDKFDLLEFYIDGVLKESWSGEMNWDEHAYNVSAGNHILKWSYKKDQNTTHGSDCAWVDFICVPNNMQYAVPYIEPRMVDVITNEITGKTIVSITNIGNINLNFIAKVEDAPNISWLSLSNNSGTLNPNEKKEIVLSYNFTSLPCETYNANMQIDVGDSVLNIPVSILYYGCDEGLGIPYVTPQEINIETKEFTGNGVVTMKNIGNRAFDYYLDLEPEACDAWLSLSHHSGDLEPKDSVEIVIYYDFTPFAKGRDIYAAELNILVNDSVIIVPIKINLLLNILSHEAEEIKVYPNPTTGEFKITSYELRITKVEIFDVYGRKEKSKRAEKLKGEIMMDISDLSNGVYFLKIETDGGTVMKKVIKN